MRAAWDEGWTTLQAFGWLPFLGILVVLVVVVVSELTLRRMQKGCS